MNVWYIHDVVIRRGLLKFNRAVYTILSEGAGEQDLIPLIFGLKYVQIGYTELLVNIRLMSRKYQ